MNAPHTLPSNSPPSAGAGEDAGLARSVVRVPLGVVVGGRVLLRIVNAYLVRNGDRWTVVDTGPPGCAGVIHGALRSHGIRNEEVSLILLTHGHFDHAGSARELRRELGGRTPIAMHPADRHLLTGSVLAVPLRPTSWPAAISLLFGVAMAMLYSLLGRNRPWREAELAEVLWLEGLDGQEPMELAACPPIRAVRVGAHTAGSVAFRLSSGAVLCGDLFARTPLGGVGGTALVEAPAEVAESLRRIAALHPTILYPGHGEPLPGDAVAIVAGRHGVDTKEG
jgi:glyoxylase-like metal-dependent hydrolase (beta-lactamase superfamily II)